MKFKAFLGCLLVSSVCFAGRLQGPANHTDMVNPYKIDIYNIIFVANEFGTINVTPSFLDQDLDCYVFDDMSTLVAYDNDNLIKGCNISFFPMRTSVFTLKIVNKSKRYVSYSLFTN